MASLTSTSFNGELLTASNGIYQEGARTTPWTRLYHCADAPDTNPNYSAGYLHVRTPLPWDLIRNAPLMFETNGFHTYSGEYTHDYKSIILIDGSDVLTDSLRVNVSAGVTYPIRFYKSSSTYGGYHRLCLAVQKIGCCCVGWIWFRWRGPISVTALWNHYAWGQTGGGNYNGTYF